PYPKPYLFINELNSGIHAIDLLTHDKTGVIRGLKENRAMAIDTVEMKIYFRNGSSISRANLDATGVEIFFKIDYVRTMVVDWLGRRLIWSTTSTNDWIFVMNLNRKGKRALTKERAWNFDIAVDPTVG
ncbi:Hypothetical predicted protein, partial [Paramuricea clavata]